MKKSTKKLLAMLLVLAMAVSMLAGCGGDKDKEADTSTTDNVTTDDTTTTPEDDTTTAPEDETEPQTPAEDTSADQATGSTPRTETLYFNGQQWGTINDWNPMGANSNNAMAIGQNNSARILIYETLFMYNLLDGKMYPLLGSDYAWNEDMTQLTVHINPDAKWNDGTALTSEDVKYTFDTHVKYGSVTGNDYKAYIEKVEAPDAGTVVFYSKLDDAGTPVNPLKVTEYLPKVYVMQKAYLQKVEERNGSDETKMKEDKMDDFVSSGPYKSFYDGDQKVVFIRNENYWGVSLWGKLPAPKYIAHNVFADNPAGNLAFQNGEVDVSQQFNMDIVKMMEENDTISTYIDESPYNICVTMPTAWFNVERPGLDKKEVRKAIAMAVDYDQIVSAAMAGQCPTFSDVPRSVMNPTDGEQAMIDQEALKSYQWTGKDYDGANALLDSIGALDTDGDGIRELDGKKLSYKASCPAGWNDWNASLTIVADAGKKIGIEIETYFPEDSTYYDEFTTGDFDICMWSPPGASISNPWARCMAFMSSTYNELAVNWTGNFGHWSNDRADELLSLIPLEQNAAKLKEYYTELSQIYLDEVPSFSLMYRPEVFHNVNESVWTGFPQYGDGDNIPPTDCTDGYGIAALYNLELVAE